ncbi:hypothetical protein Ocin01_15103 [Orchesella cincta]|uniref:Cytochrome c oxidase subunit 8B, mitochondrial n=1 Tax=Orchesella cincta TaxID=48709 RepID=A0A1D2MF60_ORCCI|nr:hypothetical protein Ocin01_15103 [Orchesella cincta]
MIGAVVKRAVTSRSLIQVPKRTLYPHTSSNHVAGMPRNRIPFPEKVATGIFLATCILATPAWVVTHMDDYRGGAVGEV